MDIIPKIRCPRCYSTNLYRFGKNLYGNQKYQCKVCKHQFSPFSHPRPVTDFPRCPVCGKGSFLHHDFKYYSNFTCNDKHCYHSFVIPKPIEILDPSSSLVSGKASFKGMRHPLNIILTALNLFYLSNVSLRKISFFMYQQHSIKVSHVTISKWVSKFAPIFANIGNIRRASFDLSSSDEWHCDETVVKISGVNFYLWVIFDSETRFVIDFHLSPYRDSSQAFSLLASAKRNFGSPKAIVSDRLFAYEQPVKVFFPQASHIQVADFKDDISNNLIEAFNGQFKAWYRPKRGFCTFASANTLISNYVYAYNFIRPHSSLSGLTPAQVAGDKMSERDRKCWLLTG